MTSFELETALAVANQVVFAATHRHLTDIETAVFMGAWNREDYDTIAAKAQYSTGYISQDVAPKFWKLLSEVLGEKVRKSNFKEALKRRWEREPHPLAKGAAIASSLPASSGGKIGAKQPAVLVPESDRQTVPSYPSGAISLDSQFYIERPLIEARIKEELLQPGALVRIKAPREMGKTSMVLRVLDSLSQQGDLSVYINFEQADSHILGHLDRLLRWLCVNIAHQLQLDPNLDAYWNDELGSKLSCTLYLQEQVLDRISSPAIVVLNRVHQIFEHPAVAKDFLPLIRSWHEEAKRFQTWKKLKIVMVHATDVYVQLNLNQSPFNVGLPIQIPPFTIDELQQLAQRYHLDLSGPDANHLSQLLGGQPALVHAALYHLSRGDLTLSELLDTAATHDGIYHHHLRCYWNALNEQPELLQALHAIAIATEPPYLEPHILHRLNSMGLIKTENNRPELSCKLYRDYFEDQWTNRKNLDR